MYKNKDWKWVIWEEDAYPPEDYMYLIQYKLKRVSSFVLDGLPNYDAKWHIKLNSNSKIQKWVATRLNISHTEYKPITFKEGELEAFLDELDQMMEVLYAKT